MPKALPWTRMVLEFSIIVLGVLVALAADRWNQARAEQSAEAAYLSRFIGEIRQDSMRAEDYLRRRPAILAALDSLIDFVDGGAAPADLGATQLVVSEELRIPPPNVWSEIQASSTLGVVRSLELREVLVTYYGVRRPQLVIQRDRQDRRGRDPFVDAVYLIGVFDPRDEFGSSSNPDTQAFRAWPDMAQLLVAVGTGHYFQRGIAQLLIDAAGMALQELEGARE